MASTVFVVEGEPPVSTSADAPCGRHSVAATLGPHGGIETGFRPSDVCPSQMYENVDISVCMVMCVCLVVVTLRVMYVKLSTALLCLR